MFLTDDNIYTRIYANDERIYTLSTKLLMLLHVLVSVSLIFNYYHTQRCIHSMSLCRCVYGISFMSHQCMACGRVTSKGLFCLCLLFFSFCRSRFAERLLVSRAGRTDIIIISKCVRICGINLISQFT